MVEKKLQKIKDDELLLKQLSIQENKLTEEKEDGKKKKAIPKLILCTKDTKYRVVKKAVRKLDFKLNDDDKADWDLWWADTGIQPKMI